MSAKQHVDKLVRALRKQIPSVSVSVDAPGRDSGNWFIDVRSGNRAFAVEYRPTLGFGLSSVLTEDAGYGEGPDEFQADEHELVARVLHLLKTRAATEPQRVLLLQELRTRRNVAQTTIASRLGVKQSTVSKIERRDDVTLSTLRRFVEALGGNLQVTATFADESLEIGGPATKVAAR